MNTIKQVLIRSLSIFNFKEREIKIGNRLQKTQRNYRYRFDITISNKRHYKSNSRKYSIQQDRLERYV